MFLRITTAVCLALLYTSYHNAGQPDAPFTHVLTWVAFLLTALIDLSYCFYHRPFRPRPFAACALTFAIIDSYPFEHNIRVREFQRYLPARQAIVKRIHEERIQPKDPPTGYCIYASRVVVNGVEVAFLETTGAPAIFFFTYESSDQCEGWLYVPTGATPKNFGRNRQPFAPNWDLVK